MENKYTYACKVIYYEEMDNENKTDYAFIPASSLEEVGAAIDRYFGDDVVSVEMTPLDVPYVVTTYEHVYNDIMREIG